MANEEEAPHANTESAPAGGAAAASTGADAMAAALALEQSNRNSELATDLRGYLQDQRNLAGVQQSYLAAQMDHLHVQMEHLHEQRELTLTHMRYQHFSDWLSAAWKVLLVILGTGVVLAAGWLVWDAKHDDGLVIQAFQVPQDLAAKGYTGTVVAERVLDHLKALQASSSGFRAGSSYTLNWGESLKVEIPETGVSLGELVQFLHERLGRQTRIGGELVHTAGGIALHVRAGDEGGERVEGTEAELEALTQQAAEKVYARTQPYRYASVLLGRGQNDEGLAVLRALATNSRFPASERAWGYQGLAEALRLAGDLEGARQAGLAAANINPKFSDSYAQLALVELGVGHDEAALKYMYQHAVVWESQGDREDVDAGARAVFELTTRCGSSYYSGDGESAMNRCNSEAVRTMIAEASPTSAQGLGNPVVWTASPLLLRLHDIAGAQATLEAAVRLNPGVAAVANAVRAQGVEDWSTAVRLWPETLKDPATEWAGLSITPQLAYSTARLGDLDAAQQLIDATPTDCYGCLRTRGKITALKKDWPTAERWFSEAAKQGPSLPFANTEWGEMLLTKGDADGAIAQCQEAVKRQPHFADAYQYWGEALLLKGDARGAIKQFEQAVKYAPKWGRIQIQWGAALKKLGRNAEAQKKFAAAEALDLVPSERALLAAATR